MFFIGGTKVALLFKDYLHIMVYYFTDYPDSYAGGSIATGRVTLAGQVKG
jgi:hypothetical protein